jgi:hypothetical protein
MGWFRKATRKAKKTLTGALWPATKTIGRGKRLSTSTRKGALAAARGVKPKKRATKRR